MNLYFKEELEEKNSLLLHAPHNMMALVLISNFWKHKELKKFRIVVSKFALYFPIFGFFLKLSGFGVADDNN